MHKHLISLVLYSAAILGLSAINAVHAAPANHCKALAQADCTAAVACSWRETITDGVSKTACIYNTKAARALIEARFASEPSKN